MFVWHDIPGVAKQVWHWQNPRFNIGLVWHASTGFLAMRCSSTLYTLYTSTGRIRILAEPAIKYNFKCGSTERDNQSSLIVKYVYPSKQVTRIPFPRVAGRVKRFPTFPARCKNIRFWSIQKHGMDIACLPLWAFYMFGQSSSVGTSGLASQAAIVS